jgi:Ca2+/H+ antiporter
MNGTHSLDPSSRPRRPSVFWLLAALVGIVLASAALATSLGSAPQDARAILLAGERPWIL